MNRAIMGLGYGLALLCMLVAIQVKADAQPLLFLNWSDYMDPELLVEFKRQTGIEVKQSYYDSDENRDQVMAASNGAGYDLILVSGLALESYLKQGWLAQLPKPFSHGVSKIEERWWQAFPGAKTHAVPYFWGTLGIAYRTDLVNQPITHWKQFFNPGTDLKGKIALIDSAREVQAMALKSLGYSLNTSNQQQFNEGLALVQQQAPFVGSYNYVDLDETSALLSGDTVAAMMYSGDALMLQEHSDQIAYVLPQEGGNIWVDYLAIPAKSKNPKAAMAFIDFLNEPKRAAQLASYVYYASPNQAAWSHLSEEFLQDKTIFPSQKSLEKSEFFAPISPRLLKKLNQAFQKIVD